MTDAAERPPSTRVILWSAPRCVSSAFERSIHELPGGKFFHEPYGHAYLFGADRRSTRYPLAECDPTKTYNSVTAELLAAQPDYKYVFVKEMAFFVDHIVDDILVQLSSFTHTFLIRSPTLAIPSFYKMSTTPELTGWDYFDPNEAGFRQLHLLYRALLRRGVDRPVIVDARDLLDDPDRIMAAYCKATGLPYRREMTNWQPGPVKEWSEWPSAWHKDVLSSSGFGKRSVIPSGSSVQPAMPVEVLETIAESQPYYDEMYAQRLVPSDAGV